MSAFYVVALEAEETAVALASTRVKAEVAEAAVALQNAKGELRKWEESNKELEGALHAAAAALAEGKAAAAARKRAELLDEASRHELGERARRMRAAAELAEAVDAELRLAERRLRAVDAAEAAAEAAAKAAGGAKVPAGAAGAVRAAFGGGPSTPRREATRAVSEARVQIEVAQAVVARQTATLEVREAQALGLQARSTSRLRLRRRRSGRRWRRVRRSCAPALTTSWSRRREAYGGGGRGARAAAARKAKEEGELADARRRVKEAGGSTGGRSAERRSEYHARGQVLRAKLAKRRAEARREEEEVHGVH